MVKRRRRSRWRRKKRSKKYGGNRLKRAPPSGRVTTHVLGGTWFRRIPSG